MINKRKFSGVTSTDITGFRFLDDVAELAVPHEHFVGDDEDVGVAAVDALGARLDQSCLAGASALDAHEHEVFVGQELLSCARRSAEGLGFAQLRLAEGLGAGQTCERFGRETEVCHG